MSLMAPYVDGKLQTTTTSSDSLSSSKSNSVVDSDTFLTLLVAEMQNQDPLEPTSNTEWVSQYATFTQVQQISEMADSMDLVRANNLIGKEVVMKVTSTSTGETSYKRGVVDYVVVEEGKPLLVIDEAKYSLSDLDTVASEEYFNAYDKYAEFSSKVAALPSLKVIDKSYQTAVQNIMDLYNGMSDYEKNYLKTYAAGDIASYEAYVAQLKKLGVTFTESTETKETTLDDLISAFDKKMSALMEQIEALKESNSNNSSSGTNGSDNNSSDSGQTNGTQGSGDADSTGGTQGSGSADQTGGTQGSGDADQTGGTQGSDDTDSKDDSTQGTAGTDSNGETQNGTEQGSSDPDEELADLLTKDNTTV